MAGSAVPRSVWLLPVTVAVLLLAAGCGEDEGADDEPTGSSDETADSSWFEVAAVTAVHDAPCTSGATPSQDGLQCYDLDEAVFDAAGVEGAGAVEDEAPICEPAPGEVVCVETGLSSTTTQPSPGTWSVRFTISDSALQSFNDLAEDCVLAERSCPTGQVAVVVDGEVVSAPTVNATGYERDAFFLSGDFDRDAAESIAERLSG